MAAEQRSKALYEQAQTFAFEYADGAAERNVYPTEAALQRLAAFDESLPQQSGDAGAILEQLHQHGSPATVAQNGGRYFGFVNGGVVPAAMAARALTDHWDQNCALNLMSPVVSRIEEVTERWLVELLELPKDSAAGFVSGTSMAIVCGLAAARYRILHNQGWDINGRGLNGAPTIRIVTGRQTHAAVTKAIGVLGLGIDNIEWVDTDAQGRIIAEQIPTLDASCMLILQAGNVNSGAFDDFSAIVGKARKAGAWIHVDGAFGLWAGATRSLKHLTDGMQQAHSFSGDGHKTLNTPYDSGVVLCTDRDALINSLQASGAYLTLSEHRDGMLYTPEMSRRARAVELWATLKYLGRDGLEEMITGMHQHAVQLAKGLADAGFHIRNDVVFNQVVVSCGDDSLTQATLKAVQDDRVCWVGGSNWNDESVIRVSVCSWVTDSDDIERTIESFVRCRNTSVAQQAKSS